MTEPIEVWRKQFQSLFDDKIFARGVSGGYINDHRNSMWHGFCLAKRSNKVVTINSFDYHHCAYVRNLCEQLTKAGIAYRVEV